MRILKTTQTYYPYLSKGGPPAKVKGIARALSRRGHEVTVLTADLGEAVEGLAGQAWRRERTKADWGWEWQDEGVKAIYLKTLTNYRATTISPRVLEFCLRRLADFQLVHVYGLYDLLGSVVARFCRRHDLPYVIEPLGMFQPKMRSLQKKRLYHALIGDALFEGAAVVIAVWVLAAALVAYSRGHLNHQAPCHPSIRAFPATRYCFGFSVLLRIPAKPSNALFEFARKLLRI